MISPSEPARAHLRLSSAPSCIMQSSQSVPVNIGALLNQIRQACGNQPPQIVIGGPQAVLANSGDKIAVSGAATCTTITPTTNVSVVTSRRNRSTSDPEYSYKVKIINPNRKSDVAVFYLNDFSATFESVTSLRVKLIETFKERVPNTLDFNVGYYEGSQQAKIWLVTAEDLKTFYQKFPKGGQVTLWCDGRLQEAESVARKRKREESSLETGNTSGANRLENEQNVEETYKKLLDKHAGSWDTPRLRLWARMICSGCHDDYDTAPSLPAFSSTVPKKRKDTLSEALTGAAVAFAKAVSGSPQVDQSVPQESPTGTPSIVPGPGVSQSSNTIMSCPGVSPGKAVDLRMKNYEQLRYLQQLYEDGILDQKEYMEQKQDILKFLRKL